MGVNILKSIDEGPFKMRKFRQTLAKVVLHLGPERDRVFADLELEEKERLWDNVKMLLEGSELTKDERESQLCDEFEHFRQNKGETIHKYYVRFTKLINDMRLQQDGYAKNAGLISKLYAYLKPYEAHVIENKMDVKKRYKSNDIDTLAFVSNVLPQQYPTQSSTIPQSAYVPQVTHQPHFADNTHLDSGLLFKIFRVDITEVRGIMLREQLQLGMGEFRTEQPVQDFGTQQGQVFQANHGLILILMLDEFSYAQTMFYWVNLSSEILSIDEDVSALYNGHEIVKTNHTPAIMHDSEDTLEIAEKTWIGMLEKMKSTLWVDSKIKIAPPDYSKENYLATFTPHRYLIPEQIFWSSEIQEGERGFEQTKECYLTEITHAKTIEKTTYLLTENEKLKAQLKGKMQYVTVPAVQPKVLAPGVYAINVEPIPPRNRNYREVHLDYLKHLKKSVKTLREIVKEARIEKPLDNALGNACFYTKRSQELLEYAIGTCPKEFNKRDKKITTTPLNRKKQVTIEETCGTSNDNTYKRVKPQKEQKTNVPWKPTGRKFTLVEQCPLTRFTKSKVVPVKQPKHISSSNIVITKRFSNNSQPPLARYKRKIKQEKAISNGIPTTAETQLIDASVQYTTVSANPQDPNRNWGSIILNSPFLSYRSSFVRFGNDHFGAIMGYGDYVIGNSVISRLYYMEGLEHNLFFVGQFCDLDLEVAFKKHSCYVRNEDGVDLFKGSRGSNVYTIFVKDMMKSSPICLSSKASKNKSWLWHRRLNHLNFGTINDLARKDLVRGLPRLKFEKDHLCFAC
ncbi:integrase, catalytic region, zinc finger, CCHC-type containing protein [Tanacetum coccineum]